MKINQIVHLSEDVAGPKNCWPGYKKTGTQPGTGKNKGKRVNDCEKIKQKGVAEQWEPVSGYDTIYPRAKVIKSKNGKPIGEIYQDTYGWGCFHYKADNGADGMSSKEEALEQLKDMHNEHRQQGVAEGLDEMDNRTPSGDRREKHNNSPEEKAKQDKEQQKRLTATSPEMRKKLRLPEPKQGVAEGSVDKKPYPKTWHDVDPKIAKLVDKMSPEEKVKKGYANPSILKKNKQQGVAENKLPKPYKKWAS